MWVDDGSTHGFGCMVYSNNFAMHVECITIANDSQIRTLIITKGTEVQPLGVVCTHAQVMSSSCVYGKSQMTEDSSYSVCRACFFIQSSV